MQDITDDMRSLKFVKIVKILKTKIVTHDDQTEWEYTFYSDDSCSYKI